jgi:hypothetical protein
LFKTALAKTVEKKVDEVFTLRNGKELVVAGINKAVTLSESRWDDGECAKYARGFRLAGKAFTDLADAIDPEGDDGRRMTTDEFEVLLGDALSAFGTVLSEDWVAERREEVKSFIRGSLGV